MNTQGEAPHSSSGEPSATPSHPLANARYVKSFGYRHVATGYAYCPQCYYLFHPQYHAQYEWLESHHMICGERYREIICTRCHSKISITRPLFMCEICNAKYLEYLSHCTARKIDLSAIPNPLVIHIEGQQFY